MFLNKTDCVKAGGGGIMSCQACTRAKQRCEWGDFGRGRSSGSRVLRRFGRGEGVGGSSGGVEVILGSLDAWRYEWMALADLAWPRRDR